MVGTPADEGRSDADSDPIRQRTAALRELVTRVARGCRGYARSAGVRRVWIRVDLEGTRIRGLRLLDSGVPVMLQGCLENTLVGSRFVHPIEGEDTFAVVF